jgi:hypothetical protein
MWLLLAPAEGTATVLRHANLRVPPAVTGRHVLRLLQLQPQHAPGSSYALLDAASRAEVPADAVLGARCPAAAAVLRLLYRAIPPAEL